SKAASVPTPMKPPLADIIDNASHLVTSPTGIRSVPVTAVAAPISVKKKALSLPTSGENSYVDQHKDTDLIHRFDKLDLAEMKEEGDELEGESKFGITWAPIDDFEEDTDRKFP